MENLPPATESLFCLPCEDNRTEKDDQLELKSEMETVEGETGHPVSQCHGNCPCEGIRLEISQVKYYISNQWWEKADKFEKLSDEEVEQELKLYTFLQEIGSRDQEDSIMLPKCQGILCGSLTEIKYYIALRFREQACEFEGLDDQTLEQKIKDLENGSMEDLVEFCCQKLNYKFWSEAGNFVFRADECPRHVASVSDNQCEACQKVRDQVQKKLHVAMLIANAKQALWNELSDDIDGEEDIDYEEISQHPVALLAVSKEEEKVMRSLEEQHSRLELALGHLSATEFLD